MLAAHRTSLRHPRLRPTTHECLQIGRNDGLAEEIALHLRAAFLLDVVELFLCLDALRGDREVQMAALFSSCGSADTNERSILILLNGKRGADANDGRQQHQPSFVLGYEA